MVLYVYMCLLLELHVNMHSPFKVPAIFPDGLSGSISEQCVRMGITRSKLIFCPPFLLIKLVHLNPICLFANHVYKPH